MEINSDRKCLQCFKPLKIIGKQRKNGIGEYNDWNNRSCHKKCYELYITFKYKKINLINISVVII